MISSRELPAAGGADDRFENSMGVRIVLAIRRQRDPYGEVKGDPKARRAVFEAPNSAIGFFVMIPFPIFPVVAIGAWKGTSLDRLGILFSGAIGVLLVICGLLLICGIVRLAIVDRLRVDSIDRTLTREQAFFGWRSILIIPFADMDCIRREPRSPVTRYTPGVNELDFGETEKVDGAEAWIRLKSGRTLNLGTGDKRDVSDLTGRLSELLGVPVQLG